MAENHMILGAEIRFDEAKLRQAIGRVEQQLKFRGPFANMATDTTKFSYELDRATQRVITLGTAFQLLSTATRTIREIARSTIEVEKAMTDINAVFRLTNDNLSKFQGNLFDISRETAKSFSEVSKAATEFARQGLSVAKTQEAVRAALILSRDANIDVAVSVKALTSATNSFQKEGLTHLQVINRMAAADAAFAVSSSDLADALTRVGSAAADAGVSFNELVALVTSAQQITARGGSVIAGAFNTIFTRINRRDTLDALESLGVAVTDVQGRMLPTLKVLENFSVAYDRMTGSVKNQAAELVGGVRQLNTLKAVLGDLSKQNSIFAQSLAEVENARDSAERRNASRNQSLDARLKQLSSTGEQIGANIGTIGFAPQVKGLISNINNNPLTEALRNAGDMTNESSGAEAGRIFIKGFGGAIMYGLSPIIVSMTAALTKNVFGNLWKDMTQVAFRKDTARETADLEKQIVALYQAGGAPLQQQLATMTSLTQQAAVFAGLLKSIQSGSPINSAGIAAALSSQGIRPAAVRRAAEGYVPMAEEMHAISRGVGGAPMSARPVYLPSFNRGGGQHGIVANTSEFIVPNMAGGSAIFNQEMVQKYGLPPGSKPVAAGGYIPAASMGFNSPESSEAYKAMMFSGTFIQDATTKAQINKAYAEERAREAIRMSQIKSAEEGFQLLEKERALAAAKRALTTQEINLSQNVLSATQKLYNEARTRGQYLGLGDYPISHYLDNPVPGAVAAVQAQSTPGPWRGLGTNGLPSQYGPFLPAGWTMPVGTGLPPVIPKPSLWSRMSQRLGTNGPAGSMALAMGLPMIGSNINERPGGTAAGMGWGALSSGLNMAGFGAATGSIFGPMGGPVGAVGGALVGGIYGALSKTVKSLDEITADLEKSGQKLNEQFMASAEVFKIDDERKAAEERGMSPREAILFRRRITTAIAAQSDPEIRKMLINRAGDPDSQRRIATAQAELQHKQIVTRDLLTSGGRIGGGFMGMFSGGFSGEEATTAGLGLNPTISGMSERDIEALKTLAQNNPEEALRVIGQKGLLNEEQMKQFMSPFKAASTTQRLARWALPFAGSVGLGPVGSMLGQFGAGTIGSGTRERASQAIMKAIEDVLPTVKGQSNAALGPGQLGARALRGIYSQYRMGSAFTGVQNEAESQLAQAMQGFALSGPISEREKLLQGNQFGLSNISMRADQSRRLALAQGREGLVGSMISAGINRESAYGEVGKLTSRGGVEDLLARLRSNKVEGFDTTQRDKVEDQLQQLLEVYKKIYEEEELGLNITEEINRKRLEEFDAEKDYRRIQIRLINAAEEEAERREGVALAMLGMSGNPFVSGSQIESGLMGGATNQGMWGNARGSFAGGFKAHFAGLKQDLFQFAEIGNAVAQSLQSSLGNAFGNFVTGAASAKDAFRSFAVSVLGDASKMFASKAIQGIFGTMLGGLTGGGSMGFAAGGAVPAMLTGGEFYLSPRAAKRIGYDTLRQINGYADGGLVRGGSGVKDDVPARLPPGSFIVRKSATQRLGPDYLQALADGRVQHRAIGGIMLGALLGGGLGYAVGGKKGALAGAVIGGIGGHFLSGSGAAGAGATTSGYSTPQTAMGGLAEAYNSPTIMMDPFKVGAGSLAGAGGSAWGTIGMGLGAAAGLGLLARAMSRSANVSVGPVSRSSLEAEQSQMFGANSGRFAYLNVNSDGGNYINSFGAAPATRRWAEGGSVDAPLVPGPHSGGNGAQVSVKIEINNNGQTSSKSSATGEGSFGSDFGTKLEKAIRPIVQDELVRQSRNDGFFTQRSRYVTS